MAIEKKQKNEKNGVVLNAAQENGVVFVSEEVVADIAALAAREVEGVSNTATGFTSELTRDILSKVGTSQNGTTARVEILGGKLVKVDLSVTVEYGFPIPSTSQQVQVKVKNAIETMTGLSVSDVNVRISGVLMK